MRGAALVVASGGTMLALFAYGPSRVTTGGIDPIVEITTKAFYLKLWTIVVSVVLAAGLLLAAALMRVGDDDPD